MLFKLNIYVFEIPIRCVSIFYGFCLIHVFYSLYCSHFCTARYIILIHVLQTMAAHPILRDMFWHTYCTSFYTCSICLSEIHVLHNRIRVCVLSLMWLSSICNWLCVIIFPRLHRLVVMYVMCNENFPSLFKFSAKWIIQHARL